MNNNNSKNLVSKKKITTIIIGIVILILFYALYSTIQNYNTYTNTSPFIIETIRQGNTQMKVSADKIPDPVNDQYGQELSYCFWIYINDTTYNNPSSTQELLHILHKGSNDFTHNADYSDYHYPLLQSPGIWLKSSENTMVFNFNILAAEATSNATMDTCELSNIPIDKFVFICMRLVGNSIEIYINSNLKIRYRLSGVPRISAGGDLYITSYNGFNGYLSKLRYYNYAVSPIEIDRSYQSGPSNEAVKDIKKQTVDLADDYWTTVSNPVSIIPS